MKEKTRAFTLVELLLVITIILLLMGMLLPVWGLTLGRIRLLKDFILEGVGFLLYFIINFRAVFRLQLLEQFEIFPLGIFHEMTPP